VLRFFRVMLVVCSLVAVLTACGHKAVRIATPPRPTMPKTTTSSTFSPSQKAFMREGMLQAFYRQLAENTRRATAAKA
jgi:predicted small lipoprotein YifL